MTPPTTEQITAAPPLARPAVNGEMTQPKAPVVRRPGRTKGPLYWGLLVAGLGLNIGVAILGYNLFFGEKKAPESPEKVVVPFASDKQTLAPWHSWQVQEDGRLKPFETYCIESVRTITGRSQFEGNDPVAVVVSWMMLYEPGKRPLSGDGPLMESADNDKIADVSKTLLKKQLKDGSTVPAHWDDYPFILCDHQDLRQELYEAAGVEKLDEQQKHGKYIEPRVLRASDVLKNKLREYLLKKRDDSKADVDLILSKAKEVHDRLDLYERIRSGGELEYGDSRVMRENGELLVLALDNHSPTWFSIKSARNYAALPEKAEDKGLTRGMMWANVMHARQEKNPDDYEGKTPESYPAEDVQKVAEAWTATQQAYRSGDAAQFNAASQQFFQTTSEVNARHAFAQQTADTTAVEMWYNRVNPFQKAWVFALLATMLLALTVLFQGRWMVAARVVYVLGLLFFVACLGIAAAGFYSRVSISGRAPVSNMYESIIWVAFMTAVFGLMFELIYRKGVIGLAGALVSTIGFVLADQLPNTFSPNIQPLQAVLRSNYWLIIHVLTIVSSYAALALAWGLGNFNIVLILFRPDRKDLIKSLSMFSYRAIQVGVALLFTGTMLGGVWANESWGRFWGWDPKEVWALIALVAYIVPLHARYVGWVGDFGLALWSVLCFSAVVMAWYGVNFVLGAGLHSYGFGTGGNTWIYFAGLVNISMVLHAAVRYYWRPGTAPLLVA